MNPQLVSNKKIRSERERLGCSEHQPFQKQNQNLSGRKGKVRGLGAVFLLLSWVSKLSYLRAVMGDASWSLRLQNIAVGNEGSDIWSTENMYKIMICRDQDPPRKVETANEGWERILITQYPVHRRQTGQLLVSQIQYMVYVHKYTIIHINHEKTVIEG